MTGGQPLRRRDDPLEDPSRNADTPRMRLSPSALNDFLACRYLTWLEQERDAGRIDLVEIPRPDAELVRQRGLRHEEAFREALIADGHELVRIGGADLAEKVARTREAMHDGADVIYQAAFADPDGWVGFADFLLRGDEPSDLGAHSYEAYDTKLAKYPKPYFILQLAFYTEQIARLQGWMPREMHVVLGDGQTRSFAYADFGAYVGRVRRDFVDTVREGFTPPYPYPVEHCAWCRWWRHCADKRRADDHLSRVAGLGRSQGLKLETADVRTMREVAALRDGDEGAATGAADARGPAPAGGAPGAHGGHRRARTALPAARGGSGLLSAAGAVRG